MIILPAIDIIDGNVVRLLRGDYDKMTVYGNSPIERAKAFYAEGAKDLHVVDLDGAKDGSARNYGVIEDIAKFGGLSIEVGGGIRDRETVENYINAGVSRVILGTAAIENPDFAAEMISAFKEKIAVGVDIKDGFAATKGWTELSDKSCLDLCLEFQSMGAETVICTDISKDGAQSGTNLELYRELQKTLNMNIIASGGVTTLADIKALSEIGVWGAIVGKALYTGSIKLSEAIAEGGGSDC
ncbi:MAG: 1-(5-phosphoribosyl)-5-[(5-phosphoribosylamino)methylideneamino]imidazole-4-carboxamide isomerase [Clostridia bacterium]|nr:1-(5-phosphoribosyl)-5-[(5-phosphoribosylamino)methylideneamino]imidazole-4-carboxamide isomerase [Clostridia bacterium]